jgi:tRNA(fMet)-specific endonuclease VapC
LSAIFMLDTDTVSFALRGHGQVAGRIVAHRPSELCLSAITLAELRYGAARRKSLRLHQLIGAFTNNIEVMAFDEASATRYGQLASELAARGAPIGEFDVMIAAHALTLGLTLVTNNAKHFGRIHGLKLENWL